MLKEKCQMTDKEWEERQKTRQLEMEAVSKALAVLSGDDAHDLFTKTFNPAFVQEATAEVSERRSQASKLLSTVADKLQSPRLATLAVQVRLDAFVRVKKAIDDMIAQLLQEKADEIKHKDFCVDELNTNQLQTERKEREKSDLIAKIEDLELQIKQLTDAITKLKAEIAEMQVQMKRAGEDREKENKEFQTTVADQRATQKLLKAALTVLQDFYGKKAALLQQKQEPAGPPPPPGFEAYKKNAASGGVMKMIEEIISDAKAMESEAIRSEEDAQKAYEDFVKETNASIEAKSKEIVNKSEQKAKAETDLVETKEAKEAVMLELEQLSNYNAQTCQWVASQDNECCFIAKVLDGLCTLDWHRVVVKVHLPNAPTVHMFLTGKKKDQGELEHCFSLECIKHLADMLGKAAEGGSIDIASPMWVSIMEVTRPLWTRRASDWCDCQGNWVVATEEGVGNVKFYVFEEEKQAKHFFDSRGSVSRILVNPFCVEENHAGANWAAFPTIRRAIAPTTNEVGVKPAKGHLWIIGAEHGI